MRGCRKSLSPVRLFLTREDGCDGGCGAVKRLRMVRTWFAKGKVVACGSAKNKANHDGRVSIEEKRALQPTKPCDLCHATRFFGRALLEAYAGHIPFHEHA
jgi:hypothetical protein